MLDAHADAVVTGRSTELAGVVAPPGVSPIYKDPALFASESFGGVVLNRTPVEGYREVAISEAHADVARIGSTVHESHRGECERSAVPALAAMHSGFLSFL